jgi:hypothetical protein
MNDETVRYLASYLADRIEFYGQLGDDPVRRLQEIITEFYENLP